MNDSFKSECPETFLTCSEGLISNTGENRLTALKLTVLNGTLDSHIKRLHVPDPDDINIAHSSDQEITSRYFPEEKLYNLKHLLKFRYTKLIIRHRVPLNSKLSISF